MKRKGRKRILVILLFFISIGFALSTIYNYAKGDLVFNKVSVDIRFANISVTSSGMQPTTTPQISESKTSITSEVSLEYPSDYYEFSFDIVNSGETNINLIGTDAHSIVNSEEEDLPEYILYSIKHDDDTVVPDADNIPKGTSKRYKIRFEYDDNVDLENLQTADVTQSLKVNFNFQLAPAEGEYIGTKSKTPLCKKATTLHTKECTQSSTTQYCKADGKEANEVITYGQIGTTAGKLNVGDAFTCDVNGDGTYDEATERFYYVSDYYDTYKNKFDGNYAALIYYANSSWSGKASTTTYMYDYSTVTLPDIPGPDGGISGLPDSSYWKKPTLRYGRERQILDAAGNKKTDNYNYKTFNYKGKNERYLTMQELQRAIGSNKLEATDGMLANYSFLLENTKYTNSSNSQYYWLETCEGEEVYIIDSSTRKWSKLSRRKYASSRPVIDVLKGLIEY